MTKTIFPLILIFVIVANSSCRETGKVPNRPNKEQLFLNYLKVGFHVSPDTSQFDSSYLAYLKENRVPVKTDSLIGKYLKLVDYNSLNLVFGEYYPDFRYNEINKHERYAVYAIGSMNSGQVYLDFINWKAGIIFEDFCMFSRFDVAYDTNVSKKDMRSYMDIHSTRKFEAWELYPIERKMGLESFLNNEFKYNKISKSQIDSLFTFYQEKAYSPYFHDTLITTNSELIQYLSRESNRIKGYYHNPEDLVYLKDQIDLLVTRHSQCDNSTYFQWIYKNNSRLKERVLTIQGRENSFYLYAIEEKNLCF